MEDGTAYPPMVPDAPYEDEPAHFDPTEPSVTEIHTPAVLDGPHPVEKAQSARTFVNLVRNIRRAINNDTSASSNRLCDDCKQLKLDWTRFAIQPLDSAPVKTSTPSEPTLATPRTPAFRRQSTFGPTSIGTLRKIMERATACELCRLIVTSLGEQKDTELGKAFAGSDAPPNIALASHWKLDAKCEVMWQVDGRERTSDIRGTITETPKTRRLQIKWQDQAYDESHVVLVWPNQFWGPPRLFLGRLLTSLETTKLEQIRGWYRQCVDNHSTICAIQHDNQRFQILRQESYFGVIDVEEMRLAFLPEGQTYAALSYTWGTQNQSARRFKTLVDNVEQLKMRNGIENIKSQLPRTILDTIALVKDLNFRYLWVDTLCILQEGHDSWALNAEHMDTVYGNASLTICAADGNDADCGLLAYQTRYSDAKQYVAEYVAETENRLKLMISYPSETYISRSVWNTRAWTFQERVLSKRCLIFVEGRVYFQCRTSTMSEDIHGEDPRAVWSIDHLHGPLQMYKRLDNEPMKVYEYCVEKYTSRNLTEQNDVLAAFSGIGRETCTRLGGESIFGLPNSHFDLALLWTPDDAATRRGNPRKPKFPSWSWCGWKGTEIRYSPAFVQGCKVNLHDWLMSHSWITWYIRDGRGNLRLVWDPLIHAGMPTSLSKKWIGYTCAGVNQHDSDPMDIDGQRDIYHYRSMLDPAVTNEHREKFTRTMPMYPYQVRMVEAGARSSRPDEQFRLEDQRFLQFRTWSALFYLDPVLDDPVSTISGKRPPSKLIRFAIQDENGDTVGIIRLDADWLQRVSEGSMHEFIAISDARGFTDEEMNHWNYIQPEEQDSAEWYAYNVLLLENDLEITGVSQRAGLGKIYKNGFETAVRRPNGERKEWKEIILG